jgi:pimeloyl-ACP methyl ester carboxylesterase
MNVFISSTYRDLAEHRRAGADAVERLGLQLQRMESFGAMPEEPRMLPWPRWRIAATSTAGRGSKTVCRGIGARWTREYTTEPQTFSGRTIDVPSLFIGGTSDWGVHQRAGAFEAMQKTACTRMLGVHLLDGAGHWVQQERSDDVSRLLLEFLRRTAR